MKPTVISAPSLPTPPKTHALRMPALPYSSALPGQQSSIFSSDSAHPSVHSSPSPQARTSSRRRRLWELAQKHHCPIIGVCFDVAQLRALAAKRFPISSSTSDYDVHHLAVSACAERNPFSEQLHRQLERHYALTITRYAALKHSEDVRQAWLDACRVGTDIPAALWAACTHPACDYDLELTLYRDIHMIQHQVGSGARAELEAMRRLQHENAGLRSQIDAMRSQAERAQEARTRERQIGERRLSDTLAELAQRSAQAERYRAELDATRAEAEALSERRQLAEALKAANERLLAHAARERDAQREIERLRDFARYAEETIEALTAEESREAGTAPDETTLSGKCILCVGGRPGSINGYREAVEQCGGRFMHHDGGIEDNHHRIDFALAAADIVICQAGCISHNAYWRVKEQCKRTGKPCMFVKTAGLSSFGRIVSEAGRQSAQPRPQSDPRP